MSYERSKFDYAGKVPFVGGLTKKLLVHIKDGVCGIVHAKIQTPIDDITPILERLKKV